VFRGEVALSMDTKGRLSMPARYRERLAESCAGRLVITISLLDRCLVVYPFPDWQRIESELQALPALDRQAQTVSHLLIGHATECELDRNARVLVPPPLREFAKLDRRVRMVGQVRKFELWNEAAWNARREEFLAEIETLRDAPNEALRSLVL